MKAIAIPGFGNLQIDHLVCDMNGTLSTDGQVSEEVRSRLALLSTEMQIHILTADTFGTAQAQFNGLPVKLTILSKEEQTQQKMQYIETLGEDQCIAIGNGNNDALMLQRAIIGIAINGIEGAAIKTIQAADLLFNSPTDALDAIIHEKRLVASLRF